MQSSCIGRLEVAAHRILRLQGYGAPERVRRPIRRAAVACAAMAEELADGQVAWRRVAVTGLAHGCLTLEGDVILRCPAFDRYLAGCREVVVFVLTLGEAFDDRLRELIAADRALEALLLDSAGWLAVEALTKRFVQELRARAAGEGLRLTRRLGPGYGYRLGDRTVHWALEEQRELFRLLRSTALPVALLESCAMQPKMSRSGVFGLRPRQRS